MERNQFHRENGILVASTAVTSGGTKKYLETYVRDLVARGIYTKICWLTGSHGKENGSDGLNDLGCLSDAFEQKSGKSETRKFYQQWCDFFFLPVEGEDPREYDPTTGQVTGIKTVAIPDWAERKPGHVPNMFKNMKGELSDLNIQIIDIAHYYGKSSKLIESIEKFQPTTLIIDWCHTMGGFTLELLTNRGIISQIMLENELSINTGRGWIKLAAEQQKVLNDIELMKLNKDGGHHNGSIAFLYGPYGSGKTVLGIECGRIIRSKRHHTDRSTEVELLFCAPEDEASYLLELLRGKSLFVEKSSSIITTQGLFKMLDLDYEYETPDALEKIGQALSKTGKHYVIVLDELKYHQDYRNMKRHRNVDLVFLAKAKDNGEKDIIPPKEEFAVKVHELSICYRQSLDTFMAHKYMNTHADKNYTLPAAQGMIADKGGRCPDGVETVWINCKEGVNDLTALERVKRVLHDERERTGSPEELDYKDHVTVVSPYRRSEASKNYCAEQGWTHIDGRFVINGYEDEVLVIVGSYGYGEVFSRARRRTVFVTSPRDADLISALSNWSVHNKEEDEMKKRMKDEGCRMYPQCPFLGQMPKLLQIDI